jgi:ABC-type sugar transport system permease subunit
MRERYLAQDVVHAAGGRHRPIALIAPLLLFFLLFVLFASLQTYFVSFDRGSKRFS